MSRHIDIEVHHNMELAHRLYTVPGKCQKIHGHGMQVTLFLDGPLVDGYLNVDGTPVDFGDLKKTFRHYLDTTFDHHLHLNEKDPWAAVLIPGSKFSADSTAVFPPQKLPGLVTWPGDPSTENFAVWIYEAMQKEMDDLVVGVSIDETKSNSVSYWGRNVGW